MSSDPKDLKDARVNRLDKSPNSPGSLTFIGLRALDPLLQYGILRHGIGASLIARLGSSVFSQGLSTNTDIALIDGLQLSPYRLILLFMALNTSIKQIIWKAFIGEQNMDPGSAAFVSAFNTVMNSLNSLLFICSATSPAYGRGEGPTWPGWPGAPLSVGLGLFIAGISIELGSEIQRKQFKDKPENKGKPYTGGLFAYARNVNYTGYTIWRTGYAVASGGWVWGAVNAGLFFYDFASRGVQSIGNYCEHRYGDLWHDYCRKTPYTMIPGIY